MWNAVQLSEPLFQPRNVGPEVLAPRPIGVRRPKGIEHIRTGRRPRGRALRPHRPAAEQGGGVVGSHLRVGYGPAPARTTSRRPVANVSAVSPVAWLRSVIAPSGQVAQ